MHAVVRIVRILVFFSVTIFVCRETVAADPIATAGITAEIVSAKSSGEMKRLCSDWFRKVSDDDLRISLTSSNQTEALISSWGRVLRRVQSGAAKDLEIARWIGFVEGRLHLSVPVRWRAKVATATFDVRNGDVIFTEMAKDTESSSVDHGKAISGVDVLVPVGSKDFRDPHDNRDKTPVARSARRFLVGDRKIYVPGQYFGGPESLGVLGAVTLSHKEYVVFVCDGMMLQKRGFPIAVFRNGVAEPKWKQQSWISTSGGTELAVPYVIVSDSRVIVFWFTQLDIAIEGFALDDGRSDFCFSTDYLRAE